MNAGDSFEPFDAGTIRGGLCQRRKQSRRQVQLRESQLGERPYVAAPAGPELQHRGVVFGHERRRRPERVEICRGAGWRSRQRVDLLTQTFEQRDDNGIAFPSQSQRIATGERQPAFDRRAPGEERGGCARDDRHAAQRPAPRRRHNHTGQGGQPQERVPLGPRSMRIPQPQAADRRQCAPGTRRRNRPRHALWLGGTAHQCRGKQNQGHRRHRECGLPRQPQPQTDTRCGRCDASSEIAHHVGRREHQQHGRDDSPPPALNAAPPEPSRGDQQQHAAHQQRPSRRPNDRDRPVEGRRREQRGWSNRGAQ